MEQRKLLVLTLLILVFTSACGRTSTPPPISISTNGSIENTPTARIEMPTEELATSTPYPTVTPFPTFTPRPTQVEMAGGSTSTPSCTNLIEFVKNLNLNDNVMVEPGSAIAKIWLVKNAGTCTWTSGYSLIYVIGEQMGGPASSPLTTEVQPGETVELRLNLIAPTALGAFTGSWMLQDESGNRFGLQPDGSQPLVLTIQIKPTPQPTHY